MTRCYSFSKFIYNWWLIYGTIGKALSSRLTLSKGIFMGCGGGLEWDSNPTKAMYFYVCYAVPAPTKWFWSVCFLYYIGNDLDADHFDTNSGFDQSSLDSNSPNFPIKKKLHFFCMLLWSNFVFNHLLHLFYHLEKSNKFQRILGNHCQYKARRMDTNRFQFLSTWIWIWMEESRSLELILITELKPSNFFSKHVIIRLFVFQLHVRTDRTLSRHSIHETFRLSQPQVRSLVLGYM